MEVVMLLMICEKKGINVKVFNYITRISEVKTLVKHISCNCECAFSSTACNTNQKWNNYKCQYECKQYRK